eukprot:60861-Chlamydomonas_euryale.AAC.1
MGAAATAPSSRHGRSGHCPISSQACARSYACGPAPPPLFFFVCAGRRLATTICPRASSSSATAAKRRHCYPPCTPPPLHLLAADDWRRPSARERAALPQPLQKGAVVLHHAPRCEG